MITENLKYSCASFIWADYQDDIKSYSIGNSGVIIKKVKFKFYDNIYKKEIVSKLRRKTMQVLVVVDMQNDFIYDALGSDEAIKIVPYVKKLIDEFDGEVIYTRDTHQKNYLETQEGKNLPVPHCIINTKGHEIISSLDTSSSIIIDKPTFGSIELQKYLQKIENLEAVTFIGVCTDICVVSNAIMAKAFLPEVRIIVDSRACAGVTKDLHEAALLVMKSCQIEVR